MAKTRSQTGTIVVKKEEQDSKDTQVVHSVHNTTRNSRKVTKQKAVKNKSNILPDQRIKVEENTDIKLQLTSSPTPSTLKKIPDISQEQISQLIRHIVNDKIGLYEALKKVQLNYTTASYYYNLYNNHPEKKIPLPLQQPTGDQNIYTQDQIANLIKYVVDDGVTVPAAAAKANMNYSTSRYYYLKYLKDPNRNIPKLAAVKCAQEQINKLIDYMIDDKMTLREAATKSNMSYGSGLKYYRNFLKDHNHDILVPDYQCGRRDLCTQNQIDTLISSLVGNKMTLNAASKKAGVTSETGRKYYHEYLNVPKCCFREGKHGS